MNRLTNETGKVLVLCAAIVAATPISISAAETVNIYSYRQSGLLKPLLKDFTARTGIRTKVLFAKKGLDQRIAAEGRNSPADVLLTVDIGNLAAAAKLGITQPVSNSDIDTNIPPQFRDPAGHWFGLTSRARIVYASRDRVKQTQITYEELAQPKWRDASAPGPASMLTPSD